MAEVQFSDTRIQVKNAIGQAAIAFLEEAAGELQSQVQRNTRVDTGQTKGSWNHEINNEQYEAVVGSPLMNAIWEEFGTGEYALNGDGRKGAWFYVDAKGEGHWTHGKRPSRAFYKAKATAEPKIVQAANEKFGGIK